MAKGKVVSGTPVRTVSYPNGNQGFSTRSGSLGGDTQPGPGPGAPFSTSVYQEVTIRKVMQNGGNPFNDIQQNLPGVLGPNVSKQNAGRYADSPVPTAAKIPNIAQMTKAAEAAAASDAGDTFHPQGVLGRS